MSNNVNDDIRDRAIEARETYTDTMLGHQLNVAIEDDDLERMRVLIKMAEQNELYLDTIADSEVY